MAKETGSTLPMSFTDTTLTRCPVTESTTGRLLRPSSDMAFMASSKIVSDGMNITSLVVIRRDSRGVDNKGSRDGD
jgi:hypothetical protein